MNRAVAVLLTLLLGSEGFITNVQGATRKVLAEMFTSTTCPPCYNADVYLFQTWLPGYSGRNRVIPIAYHVWWPSPGNDPMYLANPAPVQARAAYCQGTSLFAPRLYVDGLIDGGYQYSTWPGLIDSRLQVISPIAIVLTGNRNGPTLQLNARITAEQAVNSANWRVHWVVLEDSLPVPQNTGGSYVPFVHDAVHRTMLPSANGTTIAISQGGIVDVPRTITLEGGWRASRVSVVVFVQDSATKVVQNAELLQVSGLTGVPSTEGVPESFALSQNYPNPFNPATVVSFQLPVASHVNLVVYDLLGSEVALLVDEKRDAGVHEVRWDGSHVAGGVYLCRLQAGGFTRTRRLLLLK